MEKILSASPYIIAEVGSNWHSQADCLESISMAKACGADAVKFQLFTQAELYGFPADSDQGGAWELPQEWLSLLAARAEAVGIDFMCSAFSIEGYQAVDPYVKAHKIASSEFNHLPLVRQVVKFGKPVITSCGGSDWTTIRRMMAGEYPRERTVLMYCNAAYPSVTHDLDELARLESFLQGGVRLGYSDHSIDTSSAVVAYEKYQVSVIEKHFRLDRISGTPDSPHSIDESALRKLVARIRKGRTNEAFGTAEEDDFRLTALRRAKAIAPIKRGDRLAYGRNFAYFRSVSRDEAILGGMSCFFHDELTAGKGWLIARDIAVGEPITGKDRVRE